jgi:hypothetical protein
MNQLLKGGSSLFFIISIYKSFLCSPSFFWKITNIGLIIASFLYNSSDNNLQLLFIDHLLYTLLIISKQVNKPLKSNDIIRSALN